MVIYPIYHGSKKVQVYKVWSTPPKTNMELENTLLEKEKQLQTTNFWVPC